MRNDAGSVTPVILAILGILGAGLAGLSAIVPEAADFERRCRAEQANRDRLDKAAEAVLEALSEDPTPEADSPTDPVWSLLAAGGNEVRVTLTDVSSRLNPNFSRKKLLSETGMIRLLRPGATPEDLQQYREDVGLSTRLSHYARFFADGSERFLTCYGWANINTTDEFVLRSLHRSLVGSDPGAEVFHGDIQSLLATGTLVTEDDLPGFLGPDSDILEPVLAAVPCWNVHFLDPFLLEELLEYPAYAIDRKAEKLTLLVSERARGELTESRIASLLEIRQDHSILQYLGSRTWFWEIRAETERSRLVLIVARDPRADRRDGGKRPRFLIMERRYEP